MAKILLGGLRVENREARLRFPERFFGTARMNTEEKSEIDAAKPANDAYNICSGCSGARNLEGASDRQFDSPNDRASIGIVDDN
jgi:hypothetical protein